MQTEFDNQKLDLMFNTSVSCYRQHPYFQINTHAPLLSPCSKSTPGPAGFSPPGWTGIC